MNSQLSLNRIDHNAGIEGLVKVLPDLQANIRRFLAVRKYESLKVEQEEKKKVDRKVKRENQQNYMKSLSNPSHRKSKPLAPKVNKEKAITTTSPAMASRVKVPVTQKRIVSLAEYEQKYSLIPEVEMKLEVKQEPEVFTNIMPVQKFDENITKLMKNINDITLTLNMHDSSIIPHTVSNVRLHGADYYHEETLGYFDFSSSAASTTSPPKAVTFGDSRLDVSTNATSGLGAKSIHTMSGHSPGKVAAGSVVHADQISAVLAGIEAEYAVLARTNEQIKAAMVRSAGPSVVPSVVGDSSAASDAPTVTTSAHIGTHDTHYSSQFNSPHHSNNHSKHNSPARLPSEGLSMYTISTMDSDEMSETRVHRSHNSSSRSNLSEAYVPIRRSGDVQLDMMVQETLIRANNSILDTAIQEHKVYEGNELDRVMHRVALQINDTYQAIEGEEEITRKMSTSTVDSVGLDALTRSITAIQMGGTFAAKNTSQGDLDSSNDFPSTLPSEQPSEQSSANNSMDSQISVDTNNTELSHVSELTLAIQDILANLSGGLFDRARLQLSGSAIPEDSSEMEQTIQRNDSNFGEAILKRSQSQHQPLEMAEYLAAVNGHHSTHHTNTHHLSSNGHNIGNNSHQVSPSRVNFIGATSALPSAQGQEEQGVQDVDLRELLEHQERSMQLIRDSIRAIEAQAQAVGQVHGSSPPRVSLERIVDTDTQQRNPYYAVEHLQQSSAHAEPLAEVRVSPKPKVKKKKVIARIDSPEEQHAPTAKEMAMLRNLGNYLQRQKQSQQENKSLSYDELMQKAQSNLGLHHIKQQNQAALREEHLQKQVRQELLYDQFHFSQQKHEEAERRAARAARKAQESAETKARTQHAMMHPAMYDSDQDGSEADHHQYHTSSDFQRLHHEPDPYRHSSYSYGQSHGQGQSQATIRGYAAAHMDAPHRPYDPSHGVDYYHSHKNSQLRRQADHDHSSDRHPAHVQNNQNHYSDSVHSKAFKSSPPKEPFNMSDALLQAPALTFSDNGRSVGSKSKVHAPKKKNSVDHTPHYAQSTHHASYHSTSATAGRATLSESAESGWNDRFGAPEHKHGDGFGNYKESIRESGEELYHSQRLAKQQERDDELHEYRSSYLMAASAQDDEEGHHHEVSSQRVAPRKPAQAHSTQLHATHNNTYANSHSTHYPHTTHINSTNDSEYGAHKQHSIRQPSSTHGPSGANKKKSTQGAPLYSSSASKSHHREGEFDKGLMSSIDHLQLRPPKSIRSSASVEKSPRALSRLLHPFK